MSDEDERLARKAAAFDAWLDNIPTVRNPGGDPKTIALLEQIISEPAPQPESGAE
jgi:hypothetical protein